jgi:hypothetical protein
VDGADQSELWGVFRVGRRARPIEVAGGGEPSRPWASAAHDGYRALAGAPVHRRRVEALGGGGWRIADEVTGGGRHRVRGALRLHPDLRARSVNEGEVAVEGPGLAMRIVKEGGPPLRLEEGWYFPRMGERHRCAVVVQEVEAALPVRLCCRIERA